MATLKLNENVIGQDAVHFLIDDVHGIYSYHRLVNTYGVYVDYWSPVSGTVKELLSKTLDREARLNPEERPHTLDTVFNPECNDDLCEDDYGQLYVLIDGTYYEVISQEGGLFAVHPDCEYDEETDSFYFEAE